MEERLTYRGEGGSDLILFQYLNLWAGQSRAPDSPHPPGLKVPTKELAQASWPFSATEKGFSPVKVTFATLATAG